MKKFTFCLSVLFFAGSLAEPASAVDLRDVLTDYSSTSWSRKDGLTGPIWAIAQDNEHLGTGRYEPHVGLTLVQVEAERFSVALIPHTLAVTTLGERQVGDTVNIETDILGKYVQKLIGEIRP